MNLLDRIGQRAAERPEHAAFVTSTCSITYSRLLADVAALAGHLRARGITPANRVAVTYSGKQYLYFVCLLALYRMGVTCAALPLDFLLQRAAFLNNLGFDTAVTAEPDVLMAWDAADNLARLDLAGWAPGASPDAFPAPDAVRNFVSRIVFSSGTTGLPKPIAFDDARIDFSAPRYAAMRGYGADTRLLDLFSLYVAPGVGSVFALLCAGGTNYLWDPGEGDSPWHRIAGWAITHIASPTLVLADLFAAGAPDVALPSVRHVFLAGSRCPLQLLNQCEAHFGCAVHSDFGATEVGPLATSQITAEAIAEGRAGRILDDVAVEIVDDSDNPLPPGEEGRLRAQAPHMTLSYAGDPGATARQFKDGWFYSGDRAVLQADRTLRLVERQDDIVNFGGWKISLRLLDEIARKHPGIQDACAFVHRNEDGFDEPWLAIVAPSFMSKPALFEAVKGAGSHVAGAWAVGAIPRANGKPQRWELARRFAREKAVQAGRPG